MTALCGSSPAATLRAVLFDFVGTLVRLREPVGETYARLASEFGVEQPAESLQEVFTIVLQTMPPMAFPGRSAADTAHHERVWWRAVVERTFRTASGGILFPDSDAFFDRLFDHYAGPAAWEMAGDAVYVLTTLRRRGLRTGILSNFDHRLYALLDALGLGSLLDVVVLPGEVGAAKPDGRIFAVAVARLGLRGCEVLYVGDEALQDVAAAQAAGLRALDVTRLGSLSEVLDLVGDGSIAGDTARRAP